MQTPLAPYKTSFASLIKCNWNLIPTVYIYSVITDNALENVNWEVEIKSH